MLSGASFFNTLGRGCTCDPKDRWKFLGVFSLLAMLLCRAMSEKVIQDRKMFEGFMVVFGILFIISACAFQLARQEEVRDVHGVLRPMMV